MARILCIDYGKRRCGIAVTDELRIAANPLTTVNSGEVLRFVLDYVSVNNVDCIIIGKPVNLHGEPSESWSYIEPFSRALRKRLPTNVELKFYDERFTSTIAHKAMLEGGLHKKARQDKPTIDRMAATIILTDYLQSIYNT